MRISLGLPATHGETEPDGRPAVGDLAAQALAAEAAGVDAVFVTDHPAPRDAWVARGGGHALDPLGALGFVAAATTTVALHTNLYIPAYRHPRLTAHGVATLDHLSGGRLILGIGAGYLEDEFDALGADHAGRGRVTDESVLLAQRLWSGEAVDGRTVFPPPVRPGGPPVWVGGNSRRAVRRAAELGSVWSPFPVAATQAGRLGRGAFGVQEVAAGTEELRRQAAALGRPVPEVAFMVPGLTMFAREGWDARDVVSQAEELAAIGVTWLVAALPATSSADWHHQVDRAATELVPALHALDAGP